jgi:hypothetical protein
LPEYGEFFLNYTYNVRTKEVVMIGKSFFSVILIAISLSILSPGDLFASAVCDRECLKGYITQYLNAMSAHKLDSLPLADNVKITEDCKVIKAGEGYWKDFAGTVGYRLDIIDTRMGGAFAFVVVKNGSSSVLFGLRLKIANKKITQIETMVVKNSTEGMIFSPDGFKTPGDSAMTKMPQESQLNTREEMAAMAVKYPESFKLQNGTFAKGGVPFVAKAYRLENGQLMAGPGCTFFSGCNDIRTQSLPPLSGMLYQVALVDEQAGIVLLRMNFGPKSVSKDNKLTLDVFEAFKIYADSAWAVNAFMQIVPDVTNRTPEALFNWNYLTDVTHVNGRESMGRGADIDLVMITGGKLSMPVYASVSSLSIDMFDITGHRVCTVTTRNDQKKALITMPFGNLAAGQYLGISRYNLDNGNKKVSRFNCLVVK